MVAERAQGRLLGPFRNAVADGGAGALQRAVDRGDRGPGHRRDLPGAETHHFAQDQHRALVRPQVLKGGDERELDALALFIPGFRRRPPG
jgi:hypothetical protein